MRFTNEINANKKRCSLPLWNCFAVVEIKEVTGKNPHIILSDKIKKLKPGFYLSYRHPDTNNRLEIICNVVKGEVKETGYINNVIMSDQPGKVAFLVDSKTW